MEAIQPIRFESGVPMLLAGLRRRHAFHDATQGIARQWDDFAESVLSPERDVRYGVMCGADAEGLEYMAAIQVASFEDVPADLGRMRVPAQHYAVFRPLPRRTLEPTWQAILAWLETGSYASAHLPDFEVYPPGVDPRRSPETVEVWVGVVPR